MSFFLQRMVLCIQLHILHASVVVSSHTVFALRMYSTSQQKICPLLTRDREQEYSWTVPSYIIVYVPEHLTVCCWFLISSWWGGGGGESVGEKPSWRGRIRRGGAGLLSYFMHLSGQKWHLPIGWMPFHRSQKTLNFQGPTPSLLSSYRMLPASKALRTGLYKS
jgi:hypothetical protein